MQIDVKAIICPQCGATDIRMNSDTQGVCKVCGSTFIVQQGIDTQNENIEPEDNKESCSKAIITPEFSQDDFIRKAWITLAKEDAPLDVFNQNFGEVVQKEHQVLMDSVSVSMTYQASIGYDREEPYIAYEDYYEDEPYIDATGHQSTHRVKRQRQVTKYKIVTDWSPLHGNHDASSLAVVENIPGQNLDKLNFRSSFLNLSESSLSAPSEDKAAEMQVTDAGHEAAMAQHRRNLYDDLCSSLPGNHHKDEDYQITDILESSASLYSCQEYEATLVYDEKAYSKHTFPFGAMNIAGDTIPNDDSLDRVTGRMRATIPGLVWNETKTNSMFTIAVLALSIIVSLAIHVTALVFIAFVAAVCLFIYDTRLTNKFEGEFERKVNAEIDDYSTNYKAKQRDLLNSKLTSLGLEPVTSDDWDDSDDSDDWDDSDDSDDSNDWDDWDDSDDSDDSDDWDEQ